MNKRYPALGVLLLAPLLLTGCNAGDRPESAPEPTEYRVNTGAAFDSEAQVELPRGSGKGVFLSKGMAHFQTKVAEQTEAPTETPTISTPAPSNTEDAVPPGQEFKFLYSPYDGGEGGWETELTKSGSPQVETSSFLTNWGGKEYLIAVQTFDRNTDTPESLEKGVQSRVSLADVLDPETGKLLNTIRYELADGESMIPDDTTEGVIVYTSGEEGSVRILLVDPLTGAVVEEVLREPGTEVLGSAAGKLVTITDGEDGSKVSVPNGDGLKGIGTNKGRVVANTIGESGEVASTTVVLDGATGNRIATLDCSVIGARGTNFVYGEERPQDAVISSSSNGRYLLVGEQTVLDTETGKGFCGVETEKRKGIRIDTVDDSGFAYGSTTEGYFRIDVKTGEAKALEADLDYLERPAFVSAEGWGVFPQEGSADKAYAVPPVKK